MDLYRCIPVSTYVSGMSVCIVYCVLSCQSISVSFICVTHGSEDRLYVPNLPNDMEIAVNGGASEPWSHLHRDNITGRAITENRFVDASS